LFVAIDVHILKYAEIEVHNGVALSILGIALLIWQRLEFSTCTNNIQASESCFNHGLKSHSSRGILAYSEFVNHPPHII
jgi:hypothetical protein